MWTPCPYPDTKFGTPKGLGALLVRGRTPIEPVLSGGGQERGLRSGTQNVAGAVALAIGLNESNARMQAQYRELSRPETCSSTRFAGSRLAPT